MEGLGPQLTKAEVARQEEDSSGVKRMGMDETSQGRGHDDASLFKEAAKMIKYHWSRALRWYQNRMNPDLH